MHAAALAAVVLLSAVPLRPEAVPEPLKPWTQWVLDGQESRRCPFFQGDVSRTECAWPGRLELVLDASGGAFTQTWQVDAPSRVVLPGDASRWPMDVVAEGRALVVTEEGGRPTVSLPPGSHTLRGRFRWDTLPESLRIPSKTGLLSLQLSGARVAFPQRDAQGTLFLENVRERAEGDSLSLQVFRLVVDEVPMQLVTRLKLRVSGKSREVELGPVFPTGFRPLAITGPLPSRLESDGRLRLQARPGEFQVDVVARSDAPVATLGPPATKGLWDEDGELWAFQPEPSLRLVDVEGADAIDPSQTTLPSEWRSFATYPLAPGASLRFVEKRRGDAEPAPDSLTLMRHLWLDFDGEGFTASDTVSGVLRRAWRLDMGPSAKLGRVSMSGRDVVITQENEQAPAGVEVRDGRLALSADSRIEGGARSLSSVGWDADFDSVAAVLHLPPGWRLLHVSGVDDVSQTWLRHWTLLELFLLLVLSLAAGKLYGRGVGALTFVAFALIFPEDDGPKWIWIFLLAAEALRRVIPLGLGKFRDWLGYTKWAFFALLVLISIPFAVTQIRYAMYPALEFGGGESPTMVDLAFAAAPPPPPAPMVAAEAAPEPVLDETEDREVLEDEDSASGAGEEDAPSGSAMKDVRKKLAMPSPSRGGFSSQSQSLNAFAYDPKASAQTGPGRPTWSWKNARLDWSGPVERDQTFRLFFLSPAMNFVLAFIRVFLLGAVLFLLVRGEQDGPPSWPLRGFKLPGFKRSATGSVGMLFAAFLGSLLFTASSAHAELPSPQIQGELRERLLRKPACAPRCADLSRLSLEASPTTLRMRLGFSAETETAVPLPEGTGWRASEAFLDGKNVAPVLLDASGGGAWLRLPAGVHELLLEGPLPERESVSLTLPLLPRRADAQLRGWSLEGLHEDGVASQNLQLTRVRGADSGDAGGGNWSGSTLAPFVRVQRTLRLALEWTVETTVVRLSPTGSPIVLEVPLLPGESVTTSDLRVQGGKALVNFGAMASQVTWTSSLAETPKLDLTAPASTSWVEQWELDLGPTWHAVFSGLAPIHQGSEQTVRLPQWRPWPGEKVSIALSRPKGVTGRSFTVDNAVLDLRPGVRSADATLTLGIRSSRGMTHALTLPPGTKLISLHADGVSQPLRQEGEKVLLTLRPGAQNFALVWQAADGIRFWYRTPKVDLGVPGVNAQVNVNVPGDRWLLFMGGPRLGPAVLFWSTLFVVLLVSFALGRVRSVPVRSWQWMLLGVGLSQVHVVMAAAFASWLLWLGHRGRKDTSRDSPWWFNTQQVLLAGWTVVALILLCVAVYQGLLGHPDMQVSGNGSSGDQLRWFLDRTDGALPQPWMVSVPLLVYRLLMLAWALWLAYTVLHWLRWGWAAFSSGDLWKPLPPSKPVYIGGAAPAAPPTVAPPSSPEKPHE